MNVCVVNGSYKDKLKNIIYSHVRIWEKGPGSKLRVSKSSEYHCNLVGFKYYCLFMSNKKVQKNRKLKKNPLKNHENL